MKKKLLTILLSVFMIITAFTTRVFAEMSGMWGTEVNWELVQLTSSPNTYKLVFTGTGNMKSYQPEEEENPQQDIPWYNYRESITTLIINDGITSIGAKAFLNLDKITSVSIPDTVTSITVKAFDGCSSLKSVILKSTNPPFIESNAFNNCNSDLKILVPADSVDAYKSAIGWSTYANKIEAIPVTIADILPTDFPSDNTKGWLNEKGKDIYVTLNNLNLREEGIQIPVTSSLTLENGDYKYYGDNGLVITFVMASDKLTKIICSNTGQADYNGEYLPQTNLTIADVLAKAENDFPSVHTKGWINESAHAVTYVYDSKLYFQAKNYSSPCNSDFLVTKKLRKDGDNYVANNGNAKVTFVMDSDVLVGITVVNLDSQLNGDYIAPPKTVADILNTINDFPTTKASGWVDSNGYGYRAYIDNTELIIINDGVSLDKVLIKDGNNYKYEFQTGSFYVFNIESGVLVSISETHYNNVFKPYQYTIIPTSIAAGSTSDVEFATNASYTNDSNVTVKVDGNTLTLNTHYTLSHGSTHVTLKGSYVSTLSVGPHTITIGVDGYSDINQDFTITAAPSPSSDPTPRYKVPNTGVEGTTNNHSLLKLSSLSLLAIGTYIAIKKKKDN